MMLRWDSREGTKPTSKTEAHSAEINAVAFSPSHDSILVTGSSDKVILIEIDRKTLMLTNEIVVDYWPMGYTETFHEIAFA